MQEELHKDLNNDKYPGYKTYNMHHNVWEAVDIHVIYKIEDKEQITAGYQWQDCFPYSMNQHLPLQYTVSVNIEIMQDDYTILHKKE